MTEAPPPPTDKDLCARAAAGDRAAFDRLTDRHARPVAAWLLCQIGQDLAEDVLDDAFRRAWQARKRLRGGNPRGHLFGAARSALAVWLRGSKKASAWEPVWESVAMRGLGRLSDQDRELIRARFGGREDLATVAVRHGIDSKAADERVSRALDQLRPAPDSDEPFLLPTMPDDPTERGAWLDRHVAGPNLGRLIAELSAVHGPSDGQDLATALGSDRDAVLTGGLASLPESRVRVFLRRPALLAQLQDTVAERGRPYWDDLFDHPTLTRLVREAREAGDPVVLRAYRGPVYRRPWFVALSTAAAVLLTVYTERPPAAAPWGWTKPGALTRGDTDSGHLRSLANSADEWFSRPRGSEVELRHALRDMRDGCTAMLTATHAQLWSADRAWLAEQCVAWGTNLDRHLADLQRGRPVDEVRQQADETVTGIVQTLRKRAEN